MRFGYGAVAFIFFNLLKTSTVVSLRFTENLPETPVNISASFHDNGIVVSWDQPESSVRVDAYVVQYTTDGDQWEPTDLLFVPRSSWQLRDAEYGREYRFRVISHGYSSHSMPSEEVQISMPTGKLHINKLT